MGANEAFLRRLLLVLAAAACGGVVVELLLTGHTEGLVQWVPIGLSGAMLPFLALAYRAPTRRWLIALRIALVVLSAAGLFGIYEHVTHNWAFEQEIQPEATWDVLWIEALRGASPALAPASLVLVGIMGIGATYRHPALERSPT
jgi:hypothetical protein